MAVVKENMGPKVAVLGGGNGTSHLLAALMPLLEKGQVASLHALVHMADDGGSTGRLREQYAVGAMGDLTRCMLALSKLRGDVRGEKFLQALEFRFEDGDFAGHTLRNALLAALELTSDLDAAIATFARVLQIPKYSGVVPMTLRPVTQVVEVPDVQGKRSMLGKGQHFISWNVDLQAEQAWKPGDVRVRFAETDVDMNPRAREVLEAATHIVVAPGHTYGSILPTLASLELENGFSLEDLEAKLVYVMTLLTTPKHTVGWSGEDFVDVYSSYLGKRPEVVVANSKAVDIELVADQEWVKFKQRDHDYELVETALAAKEVNVPAAGDAIERAIVVHDPTAMRAVFEGILGRG